MQKYAVEVAGLRYRYPRAHADAVAGIDFAIEPGEVFGFLGPNGSGKTTIQRVLTGRLRHWVGEAAVLGRSVRDWGRALYERIGVSYELPAHYPKLTCRENLAAFAGLYRGPVMPIDDALATVGLASAADQVAATLSKGMQVRLNLARAIVHRPDVLFLDEPTSGLDPVQAAEVRQIIRSQAAEGCTVFITTHDMHTADEICDRVAFINRGTLLAVDTPRALRTAHRTPTVVLEHVADGALRRTEFTDTADPGLAALLATGTVETIRTHEADLSDVFVAMAGRTL